MINKFSKYKSTDYTKTYIRLTRKKDYNYKYYFYWDHDENLDTPHIKDPNKPEYVVIRGGKRAVFYEDIDKREQIPNDKK